MMKQLLFAATPAFLTILWFALLISHAFAASRVQIATSTPTGTPTSFSIQFPSSVTAGNTLLACINENWGAVNQVASVTDTLGNSWSQLISASDGSFVDGSLWYAVSSGSGPDNVTTTLHNTGNSVGIIIMEYSGLAGVDSTSSAHSTSANKLSSGNITTTAANEILLGCTTANSTGQTLIGDPTYSNFVQGHSTTTGILLGVQDMSVSTITTASSSIAYTSGATGHQTSLVASFKETAILASPQPRSQVITMDW